ncbi:MAG: hypothetical protein LBI42_05475 [Chitinispirillales bacterium]|jgi:lipoate-protein ligase A|nr:hypothetical protein [Chitinispirillales bacterium]
MKQPLPKFPGQLKKNDAVFIYGAAQKKPFLLVYKQEKIEVVHGPSCRCDKEIFIERCNKDGVDVIERRGGGGTVVLSPGMLVTIVVGQKREKDGALDIFHRVHEAFIPALSQAGAAGVTHEGISDLAVRGRKVLGSSLYMGSNTTFYYYQSSLMVSCDLSLLDRYLYHPPREPNYRRGRAHSEFCANLSEFGLCVDINELLVLIEESLKKHLT